MNIQDVDEKSIKVPEDMAQFQPAIFAAQEALMTKYRAIENMPAWPLFFQSKDAQIWFKDFLWRTTEEISEAMEALHEAHKATDPKLIQQHVTHFFEEISDAIHFFVELMIISSVSRTTGCGRTLLVDQWLDYQENKELVCCWSSELGDIFFCNAGSTLFYVDGDMISDFELIESGGHATIQASTELALEVCSTIQYQLGLLGNILKNKRWKQTAVMSDEVLFNDRAQELFKLIMNLLFICGFEPRNVFLLYMAKKQVNTWRQDSKY